MKLTLIDLAGSGFYFRDIFFNFNSHDFVRFRIFSFYFVHVVSENENAFKADSLHSFLFHTFQKMKMRSRPVLLIPFYSIRVSENVLKAVGGEYMSSSASLNDSNAEYQVFQ